MRQLVFKIAYRGTNFHGYQVQGEQRTVARIFQDAVEKVFKSRLPVRGCSRTDSGVHANGFVLSLLTDSAIDSDAAVRALNVNLPQDVAVLCCWQAPEKFHVRYDCTGKRYLYKIWNCRERNPFLADLALHWPYHLDEKRMDAAAGGFLGRHDFSAFCSADAKPGDKVREITKASVSREGALVTFSVTGDGFLYNMVRIMVGTLLKAQREDLGPDGIRRIIESRDRARAGATVAPHGLYLDEVFYPGQADV